MIQKKTAIIVGAGSSIDICGDVFPTGADLLAKIAQSVDFRRRGRTLEGGDRTLSRALSTRFGQDHSELQAIAEAAQLIVAQAGTYDSIDILVKNSQSPHVAQVAKSAIAMLIGRAEAAATWLTGASAWTLHMQKTWFVEVLKTALEMSATVDDVEEALSKILVVSFNYDRVIEQILRLFLGARFPGQTFSPNVLTVHHPYGSLGHLTASGTTSFGYRHYDDDFHHESARIVSSLMTFGESEHVSATQIRTDVDQCDNVVFFGFGFGAENLELVLPEDNSRHRNVYATTTGISDHRWESLKARVVERLRRSSNPGLTEVQGRFGQFHTFQSCSELVTDFSLRW